MNLFVHLKIAARIADQLEHCYLIKINRWGFYLGNILPDIQHHRIPVDHFFSSSWPMIHRLAEQIRLEHEPVPSSGLTPFRSVNIGMICHFISDYFCQAHSPCFAPGFFRHLVYEAQMMPVAMKVSLREMEPDYHETTRMLDWKQTLLTVLTSHQNQMPSMLRDVQLAIVQGTQLAVSLSLKTKHAVVYDRDVTAEWA